MHASHAPRPRRRAAVTRRLEAVPRRDAFAWAQPLAFDESGFPIVPRMPTFAERVRRLLRTR